VAQTREIPLDEPDEYGAVRIVARYYDDDGNAADEATATRFVAAYLDPEGIEVFKAWGRTTRPPG
jgi:hypothetical protein